MPKMSQSFLRTIIIGVITTTCSIVVIYPFFVDKNLLGNDLSNYASLILAFLTFIYVLLTYFILKSNNKAIREQLRPVVTVTFPVENGKVFFVVNNIGKRPAYKIKILLTPEFLKFQHKRWQGNYKSFLNQPFIAPAQELKCYLCYAMDILDCNDSDKIINIELTYNDSEQTNYKEDYQIDFNSYVIEMDSIKHNSSHYLEEIKNGISALDKTINDYVSNINDHSKNT